MRSLAITVNLDWIYLNKQSLNTHEIYVRGWWEIDKKKKFVHKTGKIQIGDHINFAGMVRDDNGEPLNPQYGIKLFVPVVTGLYRHYEEIERMEIWSEEQQYENTFIHPASDKAAGIRPPSWSRYGGEEKPVKKRKLTREQRILQEMVRQREEERALMEENTLRRQAGIDGRARRDRGTTERENDWLEAPHTTA
jgi:hypothetical protein